MAAVRWPRPPPYKKLSLANKRAFPHRRNAIAGLEMTRRISVLEREDCTLVAWYRSIYAPRTGGAYDSHHRTEGIAGRTRRHGGQHGRSRQPLLRLRISQYPLRVISGKATLKGSVRFTSDCVAKLDCSWPSGSAVSFGHTSWPAY